MEPDLVLFRWRIDEKVTGGPGAPFRALERMVAGPVAAVFNDPVVREHSTSYQVTKTVGPPGGPETTATVTLAIVAPAVAADPLGMACSRHLAGQRSTAHPPEPDAPLLLPMAEEYRRGLRDITDIAMGLHVPPGETLRAHQCALLEIVCSPRDPRFELHPYLVEHSPAYVKRSGLVSPKGTWSWEHEQCWARFYTPGPSHELTAPLLALWNVVLGTEPRRWDQPLQVAARLGITCP
jgi:hypothetical protein